MAHRDDLRNMSMADADSDTDTEPDMDESRIDPELRLRTVRTAASTIAESVRQETKLEKRRRGLRSLRKGKGSTGGGGGAWKLSLRKRRADAVSTVGEGEETATIYSRAGTDMASSVGGPPGGSHGRNDSTPSMKEKEKSLPGKRRNIYVNRPLPPHELNQKGEPIVHFTRNKVRTTKYTLLTFVPKNLFEQFRRFANIYFLFLVIIQVFPIFGAAGASIAWLPLAIIVGATSIKDAVEDYQRAVVDESVNNSDCVRMVVRGGNPNHPRDTREWWERLLGVGERQGKVSRGVRKLRAREGELRDIQFDYGHEETGRVNTDARSLEDGLAPPRSSMGTGMEVMPTSRNRSNSVFSASSSHGAHSHSYPPSYHKSSTTLLGSQSTYKPSTYSLDGPSGSSHVQMQMHSQSQEVMWERTLWKKLFVGDIVLLRENEAIPADIVVLSVPTPSSSSSSSSPTDMPSSSTPIPSPAAGPTDICFIETKNLDGETNLKPRRALKATSSVPAHLLASGAWGFRVDSEAPNANIYSYNGRIFYRPPFSHSSSSSSSSSSEIVEPITSNELLLRGSTLRNTPYVLGLVISTGPDSKIMLNQGHTPLKRSKIEKETNFNVAANFGLLMVLCVVTAVVGGVYLDRTSRSSRGFFEVGSEPSGSVVVDSIITFGSSLIVFQNIVPIALFISIEIVKTIQAYFIHQDIDMVYESPGGDLQTTCVPKTWNISDDLGQIEYIFSDKTGTLTQNVMGFLRFCVVGPDGEGDGRGVYGEGVSEAQRGKSVREGANGGGGGQVVDVEEQREKIERSKVEMVDTMKQGWNNRYLDEAELTLVSPPLAKELASNKDAPQKERIVSFFRALALCHTILPSHSTDSTTGQRRIKYKAESPDEAALVSCARDVGFAFVSKSPTLLSIEVLGQTETYIPLKVLEFNSTRKRMSVILRRPSDGKIILYCKGADSVIYARLSARHDPFVKQRTAENLEAFANEGLRTLCVAYRFISEGEYEAWSLEHDEASSATSEREEKIDNVNEKIERGLHILGATALEDKLQEGVPEAIEMLHKAGIKLWILTGDKLQTAIEIGYSCNLLKHEMEILILQTDSLERTKQLIEAGLNKIASARGPPPQHAYGTPAKPMPGKSSSDTGSGGSGYAIVIDGDTLRYALDPSIKPLFLSLGEQCDTVVCCRVSPAQKAMTVKLVKEGRQAMTLAIGDGANDVAMIQEANIGCGLFGLEGSQAAMSADYAFGQFRFLTKLLLVHGRWSYIRIADMHKNFFYKNVIWTFALFWFLFYNSFDATYLYDYTFIVLYNVVFTSLPVIALGAFDQDLNAKASLAFPQLYREGIKSVEYTKWKFWAYMVDGLYQSAIIYFIPLLAWQFGDVAASWTGRDMASLADFGTTASVCAIFSANQYVGINTRYWTAITWIIVYGSTLVVMLWIAIYSAFPSMSFRNEVVILFGSVQFWATLVLSVVLAVGPRFIYKSIQQAYYPKDRDIIREMWVNGDLKDKLGIGHRKTRKRRASQRMDRRTENDLEMVSMFANSHARSASEMSAWDSNGSPRGTYIPAGTESPNANTPKPETRDERHLAPEPVPMEEKDKYLHATPIPRYRAVSPAFSYYSADDLRSNTVTPVPPLSPQSPPPGIRSNNPYLLSPATPPGITPSPPRNPYSPPHSAPVYPTPPRITANDDPTSLPTSPINHRTSNAPQRDSRLHTTEPGGSRWVIPPPQEEAERIEKERSNLQTPASEISISVYSDTYATAEDGDDNDARRHSEDYMTDEGTVQGHGRMRSSVSSLDFDTATIHGHAHQPNGDASHRSSWAAETPTSNYHSGMAF